MPIKNIGLVFIIDIGTSKAFDNASGTDAIAIRQCVIIDITAKRLSLIYVLVLYQ